MSAGLEFAAGIFAIIGVAEVIVRTGREVHGFLRDISGAPEEIDRLCTTVKETTLLAETVKQILETLASRKPADTTDRITALFESRHSVASKHPYWKPHAPSKGVLLG